MIVSPYLQHATGRYCPTFTLQKDNPWFAVYKDQFEQCFKFHKENLYPPEEELPPLL